MNTTTVGVDLAKVIFSICLLDSSGRVLLRREFRREAFAAWLAHCRQARSWRWRRAAARTIGHAAVVS